MSNTWFISDTHFYHEKIIGYCDRPFATIDEMNSTLIKNWNNTIKQSDIVWHLGDFALYRTKEQVQQLVSQLHGEIRLIKGNHDRHSNIFYRESGFKEVYDHPIIINDFMVLSHRPLPIVEGSGLINIYGHIHNLEDYKTWDNQSACMCVERHNYTPVSLKEINQHYLKK